MQSTGLVVGMGGMQQQRVRLQTGGGDPVADRLAAFGRVSGSTAGPNEDEDSVDMQLAALRAVVGGHVGPRASGGGGGGTAAAIAAEIDRLNTCASSQVACGDQAAAVLTMATVSALEVEDQLRVVLSHWTRLRRP